MISLICLTLVFIAAYFLFREYLVTLKSKERKLKKEYGNVDFAILIPARDESLVISNLLDSIEKQSINVDSKNIYIIVESSDDPTVLIAKKRGINIVYRKDLTKRRKGYALDDAIKEY